jgi:hypothetical protein
MQKRICHWQSTMLETRLNIRVSRCENSTCRYHLNPISEEICLACNQRRLIEGQDKLAESLMDDIYGVELDERSDQEVVNLFKGHCIECPQYNKKDGMCIALQCKHCIPVENLIRNPNIHCPLGVW